MLKDHECWQKPQPKQPKKERARSIVHAWGCNETLDAGWPRSVSSYDSDSYGSMFRGFIGVIERRGQNMAKTIARADKLSLWP